MVATQESAQKSLDELDELSRQSERIIAESKKLIAQMEERLEELRRHRLARDILREQSKQLKKKS